MIVFIGESASGKSTLQRMLIEDNPKYKKTIAYTTRPMREGEVDGVDYHFIPQSTFDKFVKCDFFVEHTKYRDWSYGIAKEDCKDKNSVVVLTPAGLRALKKLNIDITSIYLYVDRRTRLINVLTRGDNIDEAYRRNLSDVGQFDGIAKEVDYVIDNAKLHMDENQVLKCLKEILKTAFPEPEIEQLSMFDLEMN